MTDMNFENSGRQKPLHKLAAIFRSSGEYAARDLLKLGSLTLVLIGAALLVTGAFCHNTAALPEWTGVAPITAGMVILIFLTGRHS